MSLNEKFKWSNVLPFICIFVYNFAFGLGFAPFPWFIVLEYFDQDVRETGNTICVVSNWIFAFIVVMVFPEMKESMTMFGAMLFFSIICLFAVFFGLFFIKEPEKENSENDLSSENIDV